MNLLSTYINGNVKVSIYDDGTKIREFEGSARPVHPESMDIKLTNKCDNGCVFCHEESSIDGAHADLSKLLKVIDGLPAGVEIACGGGDIFTHPNIFPFLYELKNRGLIANMTINQRHIKKHSRNISNLIENELIRGIGISYSNSKYLEDIRLTDNTVFHVIAGINEVSTIQELNEFCLSYGKKCKILVLGYKDYGLGKKYYSVNKDAIDRNKLEWYRKIAKYFREKNLILLFDNLAIEQLRLRRFFTDNAWNKFYMGNEGKFTCFLDAVKQEYAVCSVDINRVSFDDMSLFEYFGMISKQEWKHLV